MTLGDNYMTRSESENNPISKTNTPERKKLTDKQKRIVAIIAASVLTLTVTVGGFFASSSMKGKNNPNIGNQPVATETTTNPSATPEVTTSGESDRTYEQYIAAMDKYKLMNVNTFESLPRDKRMIYPQFIIAETISLDIYDTLYTDNAEAKGFAVKLPEASIDNSGQEILDINLYANQISYLQVISTEDNPKPYDLADGQKMLSAMFYEVGDNKATSDNYKTNKGRRSSLTTWLQISTVNTATKTSEVINGKDSDGVPVKYKVVTFNNQDNKTYYACFVYYEFTNYDGKSSATWLQYDQSGSMNSLRTPTAIK